MLCQFSYSVPLEKYQKTFKETTLHNLMYINNCISPQFFTKNHIMSRYMFTRCIVIIQVNTMNIYIHKIIHEMWIHSSSYRYIHLDIDAWNPPQSRNMCLIPFIKYFLSLEFDIFDVIFTEFLFYWSINCCI
jgi:hypothetical protein